MNQISRFLAALVVAFAASTQAACMEHRIGDKTVDMVFRDPQLAALARAACGGDAKQVNRLVGAGTNPNGVGLDGAVPLFWALHCQDLRGIEALLSAGADPNYRIPGRYNMVWQAATFSNGKILRLLLQHGGRPTTPVFEGYTAADRAIMLGLEKDQWENYYALVDYGLNINASDEIGTTIAIRLASAGRWDKVLELLNRGYDHDLQKLAHFSQYNPPDGRQNRYRYEVQDVLISKGVPIPSVRE